VTLNLRQFGNALRGWFGWPTEHNGTVVKWYADDAHWSMIRDDGQDAMLFRNGALVSEWTVAFYESADSFGPAALWTQVLSPIGAKMTNPNEPPADLGAKFEMRAGPVDATPDPRFGGDGNRRVGAGPFAYYINDKLVSQEEWERRPVSKRLRPCAEPRCPTLIASGSRCPAHARAKEHERPEYRRLYWTQAWKDIRSEALRQQPLCVACLRVGTYTQGTEVDHVIPHKGDSALFFNINNVQVLCATHHGQKTAHGQ
jgi:5-methylcytosine-specific restriction protein A